MVCSTTTLRDYMLPVKIDIDAMEIKLHCKPIERVLKIPHDGLQVQSQW